MTMTMTMTMTTRIIEDKEQGDDKETANIRGNNIINAKKVIVQLLLLPLTFFL
jgi:hypothetical protein